MAGFSQRCSLSHAARSLVGGLSLAAAAVMSTTAATPVAAAATTPATTATTPAPVLVTHTTLVHVTCLSATTPTPVATSVLVQARAPLSVPFGGTYQLAETKVTFVVGTPPSGFEPASAQATVGWPSHTGRTPSIVGTYGYAALATPAVGLNVATATSFPPVDVLGEVGQTIDVPFESLLIRFVEPIPGTTWPFPVTTPTMTFACTPADGTPPIATTLVGPPPGGAPPTDHVTIAVRDQVVGSVVYQAAAFVTSGNFYAPPPGPYPTVGARLYGTATFPGPDGGQATLTLAYSVHNFDTPPGDFYSVTLVALSLSDPAAGVYVHATSASGLSSFHRVEDYGGVAGGHLLTNGDPVVVQWEVRDLA